ncbi:MAG: hypothetical protein A3C38_06310 [Planctomycetes bacterium RIFCSPHIGHO2_02_FULL_50_42]|nr:MAG: hypothetical protein A2060_01355 [Planctomycetes bacterium GWA2_50_13]OHB88321.1 MAG: hypothetical protein A3C38_06310 [Planctomycetes bacterium RIFCSPHIGHO2_02_FULL_50_42]HCN19091.1 hypothetical protein [Planctomycetia bacterium]
MNKRLLPVLVSMWCIFSASLSEAVLINLTGKDVQQAIEYGESNKGADYLGFFKDWRVDLGYGTGSARIITPFSKIAFEAKNAASEDKRIEPDDISKILEESKGKWAFGVSIYGETRDFGQSASAVLIQGDKTIQPIDSRPAMKAEPTPSWPNPPSYRAICYYDFDVKEIDPKGTVTLVVSVPEQVDVKFPFDLSAVK